MADGIVIRHVTARSRLCLVELRHLPYYLSYGSQGVCDGRNGRPLVKAPILDCGCGVPHEYKTIHLMVDGDGRVMVSQGVWDAIRAVGETGFSVVGVTDKPYTLEITQPRAMTDYEARAYRPLTPIREPSPATAQP